MRERTRPKRFALAFAFGGMAVFLWQLATASPGAVPWEPPEGPLVLPRQPARPRALLHGASVLDASFAASSASRLVKAVPSWMQPRPLYGESAAPAEVPPAPPPLPATVLPLSSQELAPDGLPVSAMRCTRDGEGFDCGSCSTDGDCPAGQGCVANRETRRFECMASECEEDLHCFPGTVCRTVTTGATGATVIRRCAPEGVRREGERCDALPVSPAGSCREGLRCVNQVCSTPCSLDGSVRCAPGFVCTEGLEGPGCFPDCQELGCPDGQQCSRVREDEYQCLAASQGDCRDTPCPEGERCNMRMSRGRAVFWCAPLCNPMLPDSCSTGNVCGMGSSTASTCFRKCDPGEPEACGPGWSCSTVTEDMSVFGCTPALR